MSKLHLVHSLQFIARYVPSKKWSLLYSNVDNLVIFLEEANHLNEAVYLAQTINYAQYFREKAYWIAANHQEARPGQLKLEWICNSPSWKFITYGVLHYVLREGEQAKQEKNEENVIALCQLRAEPLPL